MKIQFSVSDEDESIRVDTYLADKIENHSRSYIQKLIKDGLVMVNDKLIKANYIVSTDDQIICDIPEAIVPDILAEDIPINIAYEDDDVIVVDKPKGMVVHPAPGHYSGTLVNALLYHCKGSLSGINGIMRPGIVHRIDKDTSGLIIACKNDKAHQSIAAQLKEHSIKRLYRAIVTGNLDSDGMVEASIGRNTKDRKKMAVDNLHGKSAITHYHILEQLQNYTYIECQLETGRTHQIRVHMAYIHHPLLGDQVYGSSNQKLVKDGQVLHAMVLGFVHPTSGQYMEFKSDIPEYFNKLLINLKK